MSRSRRPTGVTTAFWHEQLRPDRHAAADIRGRAAGRYVDRYQVVNFPGTGPADAAGSGRVLTTLFWNAGGGRPDEPTRAARLAAAVAALCSDHRVDVLVLAECPVAAEPLRSALNAAAAAPRPARFTGPDRASRCKAVAVLTRFPVRCMQRRSEGARFTIRTLTPPAGASELVLAAAHLPSKLRRGEASQTLAAPVLAARVRAVERARGHSRTVLVGDLNMNPFDDAVVVAEGLNATATRAVASAGHRTVDGERYPYFYNPMWSFFGDAKHEAHPPGTAGYEPPGTCYYPAAESRWHHWNIYDQVLVRPALLGRFRNADLRVLTKAGGADLVRADGIPDRRQFSDHLPVVFDIRS